MTSASAAGKVILFGEHAVVYGKPAIAVPLPSIRATVQVDALPPEGHSGILVRTPDLEASFLLSEVDRQNPLALAILLSFEALHVTHPANMRITITSDIPIAAGLGSGAAITVAIARGISRHFGLKLTDATISEIAFEVERLHHGTPSGVDNTVISYEMPVYFRRGKPVERFNIRKSFTLIMGHCGVITPTSEVVAEVRTGWEADRTRYEKVFDAIERTVDLAYGALSRGDIDLLGPLMDQNQNLLRDIGVSSKALDKLINAAAQAGASGAKLSGAGQGGFMIALVDPEITEGVKQSLREAGATQVFQTRVQ
ncbi:MAG: mevalonate kinase [Anaerolineales bacterium]|jgi:mevalonate kinase